MRLEDPAFAMATTYSVTQAMQEGWKECESDDVLKDFYCGTRMSEFKAILTVCERVFM